MVAPVIAAGVMTVAKFIANKGITQAIKKYGKKAVSEAKKHVKDLTTKPTSGQKKIRTPVAAQRASRRAKRIGAAVGVAGGIGVSVAAYKNQLAKAKANLKKAKTAEMKAKERANVEKLLRKLQQAESKKASSMPRTKQKGKPGS